MVKKIIISIAILVSLTAIALNYFLIDSVLFEHMNEEERLKKSFADISLFQPVHVLSVSDSIFQFQDSTTIFMDTTVANLLQLCDELISSSGGVTEDGELFNPHSINQVENFFDGENYFRSNAKEHFGAVVNNYMQTMKSIGLKSSLSIPIEAKNKYYKWPLFENKTVAESVTILELMAAHVCYDKLIYSHNQETVKK